MQLTPFVVVWAALAIVVLALALARYLVSFREDDNIHISNSETGLIPDQIAVFGWLDAIDRWGKSLTMFAVASGLVLAGIYLYGRLPH